MRALGFMKRPAVAIVFALYALFAIYSMAGEIPGRGVERPNTYTAAALMPGALILKFKLVRVPGYSHPYGFAEAAGETGWTNKGLWAS